MSKKTAFKCCFIKKKSCIPRFWYLFEAFKRHSTVIMKRLNFKSTLKISLTSHKRYSYIANKKLRHFRILLQVIIVSLAFFFYFKWITLVYVSFSFLHRFNNITNGEFINTMKHYFRLSFVVQQDSKKSGNNFRLTTFTETENKYRFTFVSNAENSLLK